MHKRCSKTDLCRSELHVSCTRKAANVSVQRSPLYSVEVMDEAMEAFSQSLSRFLLDARLSVGNDSMEHTDPALESTLTGQSNGHLGHTRWEENTTGHTCDTPPLQR